jgi:hypothetical protein
MFHVGVTAHEVREPGSDRTQTKAEDVALAVRRTDLMGAAPWPNLLRPVPRPMVRDRGTSRRYERHETEGTHAADW